MFGRNKKNIQALPDEELMRLLTQGSEGAFTELYGRYAQRLLAFLIKLTGCDVARAQDMVHDVFLKVIECDGGFDTERKFSSWIYTVAANRGKNELRKEQVKKQVAKDEQYLATEILNYNPLIDLKAFAQDLDELMQDMDPDTQLLFLLRFQQEQPIKEIASIMQLAEGTVKSRIHYLTRTLASQLKKYQQINQLK